MPVRIWHSVQRRHLLEAQKPFRHEELVHRYQLQPKAVFLASISGSNLFYPAPGPASSRGLCITLARYLQPPLTPAW